MNESLPSVPESSPLWDEDSHAIGTRVFELGREMCSCDYPYHTLWGLLRGSGVTGSLLYEQEALASVLSPLVNNQTRLMIAGTADTGTLCVVGRMLGQRTPRITVVDRCPAPLRLIDEFAAAHSFPCQTLCSDVLELDVYDKFDVILVNYTLSYVPPEARPDFFRRLGRVLAPGGHIVCAAVTRTREVEADVKSNTAWIEAARTKIAKAGMDRLLSGDDLQALLEFGAENRKIRRSWRPTREEVRGDIVAAGLVLAAESGTAREEERKAEGRRRTDVEPSVVFTITSAH